MLRAEITYESNLNQIGSCFYQLSCSPRKLLDQSSVKMLGTSARNLEMPNTQLSPSFNIKIPELKWPSNFFIHGKKKMTS